jgi:hypothetical protein
MTWVLVVFSLWLGPSGSGIPDARLELKQTSTQPSMTASRQGWNTNNTTKGRISQEPRNWSGDAVRAIRGVGEWPLC